MDFSWPDVQPNGPDAFDWSNLDRDIRGLRVGLQMDAGWGLAVDPEIGDVLI